MEDKNGRVLGSILRVFGSSYDERGGGASTADICGGKKSADGGLVPLQVIRQNAGEICIVMCKSGDDLGGV